MTEPNAAPVTRLWTESGFQDDAWKHAETAEALSGNARVILPLPAYVALAAGDREQAGDRIGILLQPAEPVEALAPYLDGLAMVALAFPAFSDGRSFSKAELLRTRHGYKGPIRATGQVLIDQIPHMLRTGFTEFEISHPVALKRLEEGRVGGIGNHYQPAARPAVAGAGYSWRRKRT
jgi:uncharacterized protein (DUF934 family)